MALAPTVIGIVTIATFLLVGWRSSGFRALIEGVDDNLVPAFYIAVASLVVVGRTARARRWLADPRFGRALAAARPTGVAGCVVAFSIPVFAAWQRGFVFSMIGGAVPWADAHLLAGGAQRLLLLGELDDYNSRRPINAMFLAVRLAVTGFDLRLAVLLGVLVLAVATFLAARAVARDLGPLPGLALFVGVYGFTRFYVPITFSETLGVTFAMLAFACLWNALRFRRRTLAVGSVFLLTIAFDVRAGVFMLPVLMSVWLARYLRRSGWLDWRLLGAAALAVSLGVGLNFTTVASLGGDTGNAFGNGGLLLYGMAKGHASWDAVDVAWARAYADHPEIIPMSDGDRNRHVNSLARKEILAHPARFLGATLESYGNYLVLTKRSILDPWPVRLHRPLMLGAGVAIGAALIARHRRRRVRHVWSDLALFGGMVLVVPALIGVENGAVPPVWLAPALAALGFLAFVVVGTRAVPLGFPVPMTLVALLAVVLSLPFIGTDSVRLFADGIAFMALPLVVAVAVVARPRRLPAAVPSDGEPMASVAGEAGTPEPAPEIRDRPRTAGALPLVVGGAFLATLALGTPLAMAAVDPPDVAPRRCSDGRAAEPLIGGVAVRVVADPVGPGRAVDEVGLQEFTRQAVRFAPVPYNHLAQITAPATLIGGLTPAGVDRFAIVDADVQPPKTSVLYLCGQVQRDPVTDLVFSILPNPTDVFRGRPLAPG